MPVPVRHLFTSDLTSSHCFRVVINTFHFTSAPNPVHSTCCSINVIKFSQRQFENKSSFYQSFSQSYTFHFSECTPSLFSLLVMTSRDFPLLRVSIRSTHPASDLIPTATGMSHRVVNVANTFPSVARVMARPAHSVFPESRHILLYYFTISCARAARGRPAK